MEDDQLRKGTPPVSVRIVAMGELTVYMISEQDLDAIERGSPSSTMFSLANTLLSVAVSLLGSLLLSGPPTSLHSFNIFTILITVCSIVGVVLFVLSRHFKNDSAAVIARIRSGKNAPKGPPITTQSLVVDVLDEEKP